MCRLKFIKQKARQNPEVASLADCLPAFRRPARRSAKTAGLDTQLLPGGKNVSDVVAKQRAKLV